MANWPQTESGIFEAEAPVTGAEAAVILQNALDLTGMKPETEELPTWTESALAVMNENGIPLTGEELLNRAKVAQLMYQISCIAPEAPGMMVFKMQQ